MALAVERHHCDAETQVDVVIGVPGGVVDDRVLERLLALQVLLGQWRSLVRQVALVGDQRQRSVVTLLAQRFDRLRAGQSTTDDHDALRAVCHARSSVDKCYLSSYPEYAPCPRPVHTRTCSRTTRVTGMIRGMTHEVRGVVAAAKGEPVRIETILVPDPGPGEALVKIQACGVCHTDLHYREGGINDDFPFLLGHEAAGIVESVGDDVTDVAPGDFVILNWRAVCGDCRACRRGRPWYCFNTHNATQKMTLQDGTVLSPALGIGAFVEKTLVHAGQCTKVDPVGQAGGGRAARVRRDGRARRRDQHRRGRTRRQRCGHRLRRGRRRRDRRRATWPARAKIIAVDVDDRKLETARGLGATHTVNSKNTDPVKAIQDLTDGNGADVVVDAVGRPETYEQAFYARDLAGTVVLVGVPTPDMRLDLPLIDYFGRGGALKSSWYGDCLPSRDFPMLVDLHLQGRLPLEKFVSETIALDGVEEAFAAMHRGDVLRSVVLF